MIHLIDVPGIRLIETCMATGDRGLIPGRISIQAFANQVTNVNFGTTEAGLFPEPSGQCSSESECLAIEARTERALSCFKSDWLNDDEQFIAFFRLRGVDVTNGNRKRAKSAVLFSRIIEAGHLGWLGPCPCPRIERWRQIQMNIGALVTGQPANDTVTREWVTRYGLAS